MTNLPGVIDTTTVKSRDGQIFRTYQYVYDPEGRISQTQLGGTFQETTYYDQPTVLNGVGKATGSDNSDASTSADFDKLGRVTEARLTVKKNNLNKLLKVDYAYNATNGNLSQMTYGDNKSVNFTYDPTTQRMTGLKYDSKNVVSYTYNSNGTIATMGYGNGITMKYTYAKDVLLSKISVVNAQNVEIYSQNYSYDANGLMSATDHTEYVSNKGRVTRSYAYDTRDEITSIALAYSTSNWTVANTNKSYDYVYDANGNALKYETPKLKDLAQNNMVIDTESDRLTERKNPIVNQSEKFTYDGAGNMTRRDLVNTVTGVVISRTEYVYNYQDQLSVVSQNGQIIAEYGYDPNRQRIYSKTYASPYQSEKYYYWSGGQIIAEGDTQRGDYTVRYIYSGNQKVAMVRKDATGTEKLYYFINNAQGTPVMIMSDTGNPVSKIALDEWGNLNQVEYGNLNEVNYTGKKYEPATGLYYFNQRYYDPRIGRFLSEDPAGQAFNPYLYGGNNPMGFVDPDGEWFFDWVLSCFGPLGTALGTILDAAIVEGAKSAAINATSQLAFTGKIDMNSVGQSFISGGITAGLGAGGGLFKAGGAGILDHMLTDGLNAGITNAAVGAGLGRGNAWDNFTRGFGNGAVASLGKQWYQSVVGYRPRMESGEGVVGKDRLPGENAKEWYNAVGNPVTNETSFINDLLPGREGGPISNIVNFIPGGNSFAQLHDNLDVFWRMGLQEKTLQKDVWSFVLFAPALIGTGIALYPEIRNYYR